MTWEGSLLDLANYYLYFAINTTLVIVIFSFFESLLAHYDIQIHKNKNKKNYIVGIVQHSGETIFLYDSSYLVFEIRLFRVT